MSRMKFQPLPGRFRIRDSGTLPHWDLDEGLYFVTFRLADSLPASFFGRFASTNKKDPHYRREVELALDRARGECYLRDPRVAEVIVDSLEYLDGKAFALIAWCIMPNHVHIIFRLQPGYKLAELMHSLKTYTARHANKILERRGPFWQPEYFDRLIRRGKFHKTVDYVLNNPEKAGLKDWPWVWAAPDI